MPIYCHGKLRFSPGKCVKMIYVMMWEPSNWHICCKYGVNALIIIALCLQVSIVYVVQLMDKCGFHYMNILNQSSDITNAMKAWYISVYC